MTDQQPETADPPALTRIFAEFAAASRWTDLPQAVRADVRQATVNIIAATIGGTRDPCMDRLLAALNPFMGERVAVLPGRSERVDVPNAAFLNAVSANVLDFDDTHSPTLIHPGAIILPPLLALAETEQNSGVEVLHAFALGIEVACRLGKALHPQHYERGWHITTTCGVIGAALACAKLLGLDAARIGHAMGIAANTAGGLVENLSSMAKSVGVGNAARNGLLAAVMARAGIDAAATTLEGPFGFVRVMADHPNPEAALQGLGTQWEVFNKSAKPYPSCALAFPVIDAVLEIRSRPAFSVAATTRVVVRGSPLMLVRAGRATVATGREAKLSIRHCVAIALLNGSARVQDFLDSTVNDPTTVALAALVDCESDSTLSADAAIVAIHTRDGHVFEACVANGRGSPQRPLTDEELDAKARGLLAYGAPTLPADAIMAMLANLESLTDVGALMALTVTTS